MVRNLPRPRQGVMLCYPFSEERFNKWKKPVIVQPKYDGMRCKVICSHDKITLVTSSGLEIKTVPHIVKEMYRIIGPGLAHPITLDGELYLHGNFQGLCSRVKRGSLHPDHYDVRFVAFDLIHDDPQTYRLAELKRVIPTIINEDLTSPIYRAPSILCNTMDEVYECLLQWYNEGYEGVILRNKDLKYEPKRSTMMMKWKPTKSDEYVIIAVQQEYTIHGDPKEAVGALTVKGLDNETFNVGTGFTRDQREAMWQARSVLPGKLVLIKYQELTRDGIPRFPVFMEVV